MNAELPFAGPALDCDGLPFSLRLLFLGLYMHKIWCNGMPIDIVGKEYVGVAHDRPHAVGPPDCASGYIVHSVCTFVCTSVPLFASVSPLSLSSLTRSFAVVLAILESDCAGHICCALRPSAGRDKGFQGAREERHVRGRRPRGEPSLVRLRQRTIGGKRQRCSLCVSVAVCSAMYVADVNLCFNVTWLQ